MVGRTVPALAVLWAAACSAQPAEQAAAAAPQIPPALHGCWQLREAPDEEFPEGLSETMTIAADRIVTDAKGADRQVGTIEQVDSIQARRIRGRISAKENGRWSTMATELQLDPDGAPPGTLLLREGDAGSYHFTRCSPATAAAAQRFSLVIAKTGRQDDPKPAPCGPGGACGDFLYRGEFHDARVLAGADLPRKFGARLKLHTPYISSYVLALLVERQEDGTLLVRRQAGFNGRTGIACFNAPDEWPVEWRPEQVSAIRHEHGDLCVFDPGRIDANAPKD